MLFYTLGGVVKGIGMRIGVDVGGTKIEAAAMNYAGELILRRRIVAPMDDYDATIQAIAALIEGVDRILGGMDGVDPEAAQNIAEQVEHVRAVIDDQDAYAVESEPFWLRCPDTADVFVGCEAL